jgi:hypothetical protein
VVVAACHAANARIGGAIQMSLPLRISGTRPKDSECPAFAEP